MKNLKFFIPLLILGLFSTSCNNDDDDNSGGGNVDQIVGIWKITDIWVGGQSVYAIIQMTDPCPLESKFIFNDDYSAQINTREADQNSGNCIDGEVQNGTWSKEGNTYFISAEGQSANSQVEFLDANNFTFMYEFEGQQAKIKLSRQ